MHLKKPCVTRHAVKILGYRTILNQNSTVGRADVAKKKKDKEAAQKQRLRIAKDSNKAGMLL